MPESSVPTNGTSAANKETLQRSILAGQWSLVSTIFQRAVSFLTFFVTVRLLTPADFGVISLAAIVPGLLDAMTAIGFEAAIILKKPGEEKQYLDVTWTFNIVRSVGIFFIVFLIAPYIASFFHSPDALLLFRLGGIVQIFQSITNIGQLYFSRDIDFRKFFYRDVFLRGSTGLIAIVGVIFFRSYWVLFISNAAGILIGAIATYFLNDYRPRLDFHFKKLAPIFSYSWWAFIQELLTQLMQAFESTVLGRYLGSADLGIYSKARGVASAPTSPIVAMINKISFSSYSRLQESIAHVREGFYKSFEIMVFIALPFAAAIYVVGEQMVIFVLGAQWAAIVPNLKLLTLASTINVLSNSLVGPLLSGIGKTRLLSVITTIGFISYAIPLLLLVQGHGIYGAVIAVLISTIITCVITMISLHQLITIGWMRLIESFSVTTLATLAGLAFVFAVSHTALSKTIAGFFFTGTIAGILYLVVIILFGVVYGKGPYKTLLLIARSTTMALKGRLKRKV